MDGSAFLLQVVRHEWFFDFYMPRLFAMLLGQVPIMIGVKLGVSDLHVLAVLLSLGLFGLPTLLYQIALARSAHDPMLMAVVLAAIGVVFMTTSFFIVGEYNSAYAIAILTAVHLASIRRLRVLESVLLLVVSGLAIRTYEALIYLGPLLAAMVGWTVWRHRARPFLPAALYLLCAVFFLLGMLVAVESVVHPWSPAHLNETYETAQNFWQNMQFDLAFGGVLVVAVWGLLHPADLLKRRPYLWGGLVVAVFALSPLLAISDTLVRPLAKSQYVARSAGGLVIVAMVVFLWAYASDAKSKWKVLVVAHDRAASGKMLVFAFSVVLASLPSDLFLTQTWVGYLDALRATVRSRPGIIAFEDTPLSRLPHFLLVENWVLSSQSLVVRSKPGDAIIAPPVGFNEWVPFPPADPPNIRQFVWRD
ncbi:MAG: hypothetical protein JO247_01160 [Chloroflexi bacterium]|nr:hypothetical protein [Chloroflexota bacterium]